MSSEDPKFIIEPNKRYHPNSDGHILLQNTANAVSTLVATTRGLSNNTISFNIPTNGNFFERGVVVDIPKIPLKFKLKDPVAAVAEGTPDVTKVDFLQRVFNGCSHICLQQFSFLNAIQSVQVELDGAPFMFLDIDKKTIALAPYYEHSELHRYFDHSLPDTMNQLALYRTSDDVDTNAANYLHVLTANGATETLIKRPNLSVDNIFDSVVTSDKTSRMPVLEFVDFNTTTRDECTVNLLDQSIFLPCTLFGITGDDKNLHNIDNIGITIQLRSDWVSKLFCFIKPIISFFQIFFIFFNLFTSPIPDAFTTSNGHMII
jgi:hypothetical protein